MFRRTENALVEICDRLEQWFLAGGDFISQGTFGNIWGHVQLLQQVGVMVLTGIWWMEARDAAKHSTVHQTAPIAKNYCAQNVGSANIKKPYAREISQVLDSFFN